MKLTWLVLLCAICLICLFGCAPGFLPFHYIHKQAADIGSPRHIPIWIDADFGEGDLVAIDDAVMRWNYALNGYIRLDIVSTHFNGDKEVLARVERGEGWLIRKVNSKTCKFIPFDKSRKDHAPPYAWVDDFQPLVGGHRLYMVRDTIPNEYVTGVTLHEMGHLLGAPHTHHDLMQPYYYPEVGRCIDETTIAEVALARHLPLERLNYCYYGDNGPEEAVMSLPSNEHLPSL